MSSSTLDATSFISGVSLPMSLLRTGPWAGNVSVIVSAWKRTTASVIMGWNTPHAPFQGSVRSSICKPSSFRPSTYVFSQSLRPFLSLSMSDTKSPASDCKAPSFMYSAKLSSKPSSPSSSPGVRVISTPSMPIVTSSGSTISISSGDSCSPSASMPMGCWYRALSMFVAMCVPSSIRVSGGERSQGHLSRPCLKQ